MAQKFRKKPVVIEALQWNGRNAEEISAFITGGVGHGFRTKENEVFIETPEGQMTGSKYDWIIKGVQGEFYPCKPNIFAATYEPVE